MHHTRPVTPTPLTRRRFLTLTGGAGAAVLLAGCGGGGGGPQAGGEAGGGEAPATDLGSEYTGPAVNLAFWNGFTGGDGPLLRDLVEQFNGEHDNIAVEMNVMEWANFYDTVPNAVSSGQGPDVGIMHIDQLGTNAARGVIAPLDPVAEVLGLSEDDFSPPVWQAGIYDGQRYGIPLDVHPFGFYFNKDLMEEAGLDPEAPPQTREEYESALAALSEAGIQGHWVSSSLFTGGLSFESLIPQFGGRMFTEDATAATWDSPEALEAAEWLLGLVEQGYSPGDVANDAEHVAFQNGDNAFIWNGIWQINTYRETPDLNWGVAPLPTIGSEAAVWGSSHNFVIMQPRQGLDENKLQASTVFINWISEHSLQWAEAGQVPARNSVRESEEFQALEEQAIFAEQLPDVHYRPIVPGVGDAMAEFEAGWNEAALGQRPVEEALSRSADRATQLLEQAAEQFGTATEG